MQTSHIVLIPARTDDLGLVNHYITETPAPMVQNLYREQWAELFQLRNPTRRYTQTEWLEAFETAHLGQDLDACGAWVYYPWSGRLLHILGESDFVEVRTSRNQLKITSIEQGTLQQKTIGIVGLSVGAAIATTIALERGAGRLKLADFDTLELSNLNRIKAGLHQTGVNKALVAAQEIAEFDPYLQVEIFDKGLTNDNIDDFFEGTHPLDLLVEECDDLVTKQLVRLQARKAGIPVVMETNDRGMLDIERFDLEPNRPILHGLMPEDQTVIKHQTPAERMAMVWQIINGEAISPRLKESFAEIGKSLTTWPQLGSSVIIGGGVVADVTRKILLGQPTLSGRYYVDLDQILGSPAEYAFISEASVTV